MKQTVNKTGIPTEMSEKEFQLRFKWLYPHLEKSGKRLRMLQRNRKFTISTKKDGSKVTTADEEISDYWLEHLTRAFPGEPAVSEESETSQNYPSGCDTVWYIDPIDGTSKFIDGLSSYFVLVSLCMHGSAVFGVLYQPERHRLYYGNPFIRARLYTSADEYCEMYQTITWKDQLPLVVKGAQPPIRKRIEAVTQRPVQRTSPAAHNIFGPLGGTDTGFISFRKTAYWDLAAPSAIMNAAGFHTIILNSGNPAKYNDGEVYCDRFFCLPYDTPGEFVDYITTVPL